MKCPKCKEEINCVSFDVTATCSGQISKEDVKKGINLDLDYDLACLTSNVEFSDFRCPECSELIGKGTQEDAIKFLKG